MNEILEMADKLGKAVAASAQAKALHEARKLLDAQPDVLATLKQVQEQSDKMSRLEREKKPIEVEDKHRMAELQDKLLASDIFKKFTAAQVEYVDLMRQVNDALRRRLAAVEK
jgi:hypothetical protein